MIICTLVMYSTLLFVWYLITTTLRTIWKVQQSYSVSLYKTSCCSVFRSYTQMYTMYMQCRQIKNRLSSLVWYLRTTHICYVILGWQTPEAWRMHNGEKHKQSCWKNLCLQLLLIHCWRSTFSKCMIVLQLTSEIVHWGENGFISYYGRYFLGCLSSQWLLLADAHVVELHTKHLPSKNAFIYLQMHETSVLQTLLEGPQCLHPN